MAEVLTAAEANEQLADKVADDLVVTLKDPEAKSPFLPIIIGLLPVLADLLANNCAPENAAGLKAAINQRGLRGRLFRWQYRNALKRVIANDKDYAEWGTQLGDSILKVVTDDANAELVDTAMIAKPIPIWGAFGTSLAILICLLFFAPSAEAQVFSRNAYGQMVDEVGDVVVSVNGVPVQQSPVSYGFMGGFAPYVAPRTYLSPYGIYRSPYTSVAPPSVYRRVYVAPAPVRRMITAPVRGFSNCVGGMCGG